MKKNAKCAAPPFDISVSTIRLPPVDSPSSASTTFTPPVSRRSELWLTVRGSVEGLQQVELLNLDQRVLDTVRLSSASSDSSRHDWTVGFQVAEPLPDQVMLRIRYHDKVSTVEIPFEVTASIGL